MKPSRVYVSLGGNWTVPFTSSTDTTNVLLVSSTEKLLFTLMATCVPTVSAGIDCVPRRATSETRISSGEPDGAEIPNNDSASALLLVMTIPESSPVVPDEKVNFSFTLSNETFRP